MAGVFSIPKDFSIAVQDYIIGEIRDVYPTGLIPMVTVDGEPYTSRIPYTEDLDVSMGVLDWNADQAAADARLKYLDVQIHGRQIKLGFSTRDFRRSGPEVISAKNKAIIGKFLDELDFAVWHGNAEGAVAVGTGLISQMTDINAKITEAQATAIVVYGNMIAMVQNIASKYRSRFPVALMLDWASYDLAVAGPGISGFSETAMETFKKAYPNVFIFPTDTILAVGDVAGTNGRMAAFAQNQDLLRNIMVKPPSAVGPAIVNLTGNTDQLWGSLWGIKVIQTTATTYTGTTLTF